MSFIQRKISGFTRTLFDPDDFQKYLDLLCARTAYCPRDACGKPDVGGPCLYVEKNKKGEYIFSTVDVEYRMQASMQVVRFPYSLRCVPLMDLKGEFYRFEPYDPKPLPDRQVV